MKYGCMVNKNDDSEFTSPNPFTASADWVLRSKLPLRLRDRQIGREEKPDSIPSFDFNLPGSSQRSRKPVQNFPRKDLGEYLLICIRDERAQFKARTTVHLYEYVRSGAN